MIVATAGHVDHGKTTIVRSLTGIDTDRLPEEKARGLTIDLGFAYRDVEDAAPLGFVDVPGHERFVKNMLAGVSTIDFALLVVAADDGPMPQTREHLDILTLLGISRGAIAISKVDRVSDERLIEVIDLVEAVAAGSPLDGAPVFPVSGITGDGMDELQAHLLAEARAHQARSGGGRFRLSIDRSFTLSGAGVVVTGACSAGEVRAGDRLLLSPSGLELRVRGLRVQDREAEVGRAGDRCALNIAGSGIERAAVRRGDWVLDPALHQPTARLDVELSLLPGEARPLKHWTPAHLHLGAADVTCRIALLQGNELLPGETGLARLALDEPICALYGDRYVLRDQSAQRTLGGGFIVDPFPPARGRARPERIAVVEALRDPDAVAALTGWLAAQPKGVDLAAFARARNLTDAERETVISAVAPVQLALDTGPVALNTAVWEELSTAIMAAVKMHHQRLPESPGPSDAVVRSALPSGHSVALVKGAIAKLVRDRKLVREGMSVRLPSHKAKTPVKDERLWQKIEPILLDGGMRPPRVRELAADLNETPENIEAFLRRAARRGLVFAVAKNRYFPPQAVRELAEVAERLAGEASDGMFDAAEYRNRTGIGRNVAIEVLEFFDSTGFTRRQGNARKVMRAAETVFGAAEE